MTMREMDGTRKERGEGAMSLRGSSEERRDG